MKRLLFLFLFLIPILSFGQATIQLKHDTTNVWVGQYQHPVNTLRAKFVDSDSTLAIIGTDNTIFSGARKYNTYTDDTGSAFTTYAALKAWVRQYFFVDASANGIITQIINGGYFIPATTNIVTTDTLTISNSGTYTFTGTSGKSWKMPTVASATGMTIFILNRSLLSNLTINSNSGDSDLDKSGVYSSSIIVLPGETYVLRGNSLKLAAVNN